MSTLKQILANRRNAKKSTGATSPEGKAKVALNRTKHGLTGSFRLLPNEDVEQYEELLNQYMADEKPVGIAEVELVKTMVQHLWMSRRADCFQTACFMVKQTPEQAAELKAEVEVRPELERYLRYQAHHYRQYQKASSEFLKRKEQRRKAEIGFESQKRAERQEERRDAKENRDVDLYKVRYATAQKQLELAEVKVLKATVAASKQLDGFLPPELAKMAA